MSQQHSAANCSSAAPVSPTLLSMSSRRRLVLARQVTSMVSRAVSCSEHSTKQDDRRRRLAYVVSLGAATTT